MSLSYFATLITRFIKPILLPVVFSVIPTLYYYGNNVEKLTLANLSRMLFFNALLAILFYFVLGAFNRFHPSRSAILTILFLLFFNLYGIVYRFVLGADLVRLTHYTFLPLVLLTFVYVALPLTRLKEASAAKVWNNLFLLVGLLAVYNAALIIPTELSRWMSENITPAARAQEATSETVQAPDIYYIVLDEFAGFQAMREYWGYQGVDSFVDFLNDRGFFVAEESHGDTINTLHEMATRLNYQHYSLSEESTTSYFDHIADNRVMRFLEARGYTTVVFDETRMGYPAAKTIRADFVYEYGSPSIPQNKARGYALYFDEFGELVMDNTMLYALSEEYKKNDPKISQHTNMIYFTVDHVADSSISSPKFVYVHLLLPHAPFIFTENGEIADNDHFTNWNYYIDTYKFSINVAETMIDNILQQSDPENPPVIILQSDHGARNSLVTNEGSAILPNYPEEYKSLILYALLLPGYDTSSLPHDIDPINTFPIVFNHLFQANIEVAK